MTRSAETVRHPIFARVYARMSVAGEDQGQDEHRAELLAGLSGRVIEVGAGNGLNFARYPAEVEEVVAVEPEPYLRERAQDAAARAGVTVRVVDGVAGALPVADGSADAVVASLVLCSVPSQAEALAEMRRVLRPGGELRFYEHVRAQTPRLARVQRALDATVWPRIGGGCHLHRDTAAAIEGAGFRMERLRRFSFRPAPLLAPVEPHIIGRARRA